MSKYLVTYECEIDSGNVPTQAMAEYLLRADSERSDWNVWEITAGEMKLVEVKEKND